MPRRKSSRVLRWMMINVQRDLIPIQIRYMPGPLADLEQLRYRFLGKQYPAQQDIVDGKRSAALARAIGDSKHLSSRKICPIYPILFKRNLGMIVKDLGVDPSKLLHVEQEFKYLRELKPGEIITTLSSISDIYSREGMVFIVVESKHYSRDELVGISRGTYLINDC